MEGDLLPLIDLIYEASFDSTLWQTALIRFADLTGTAQVSLAAMDRRAQTYDSIAPGSGGGLILKAGGLHSTGDSDTKD